jgi:hypothetical protein
MTASTIPPLSVWPCGPPGRVGKHKGAQTAIGPSQSPSRSLETARPVGRASALDLCPGAKVSGSQTDLLTPWYDGRAEIIPFRYLPVLIGGKGTNRRCRVVSQRLRRLSTPITPSGWHALRAGVWHRRRVGVVAVSCRRVIEKKRVCLVCVLINTHNGGLIISS